MVSLGRDLFPVLPLFVCRLEEAPQELLALCRRFDEVLKELAVAGLGMKPGAVPLRRICLAFGELSLNLSDTSNKVEDNIPPVGMPAPRETPDPSRTA